MNPLEERAKRYHEMNDDERNAFDNEDAFVQSRKQLLSTFPQLSGNLPSGWNADGTVMKKGAASASGPTGPGQMMAASASPGGGSGISGPGPDSYTPFQKEHLANRHVMAGAPGAERVGQGPSFADLSPFQKEHLGNRQPYAAAGASISPAAGVGYTPLVGAAIKQPMDALPPLNATHARSLMNIANWRAKQLQGGPGLPGDAPDVDQYLYRHAEPFSAADLDLAKGEDFSPQKLGGFKRVLLLNALQSLLFNGGNGNVG